MNSYRVKVIDNEVDLKKVQNLRYQILFEDQSLDYPYANHQEKTISFEYDAYSIILACFAEDTLVGTVTTTPLLAPSFLDHQIFNFFAVNSEVDMENSAYTSAMVTLPAHRNNIISTTFMVNLYKLAVLNRIRFNFVAIFASAKLENYYQPFGFQVCSEPVFDPEFDELRTLLIFDRIKHKPLFDLSKMETLPLTGWENSYFRDKEWYKHASK